MNKYYTPTIEEFHVGFEYEEKFQTKNEWRKTILEDVDDFKRMEVNVNDNDRRVKYLDREDIESLGFEVTNDVNGGLHPSYDRFFKEGKSMDYIALYNYADQWLTIHSDGEPNDIRFYGIIKNKSELKRILKQIGI